MRLSLSWLWRRRRNEPHGNGAAAAQAKIDSQRRLRETRNDWPRVIQARNELAEMWEAAMRARRSS